MASTERRPDLADLERPALESALEERGHPRFHARQIFRWIYKRGITDFTEMTDLSRPLRARLADACVIHTPRIVSDETSVDGTRKLVLTTPEAIEARTDPWDPSTAPSAKQAEVAKHAEEAARYLAEGEAELDRMLGMAEAKRLSGVCIAPI